MTAYAELFDLCEERGWQLQLATARRPSQETADVLLEVHRDEDEEPLVDAVLSDEDSIEQSAARLLRRVRSRFA